MVSGKGKAGAKIRIFFAFVFFDMYRAVVDFLRLKMVKAASVDIAFFLLFFVIELNVSEK